MNENLVGYYGKIREGEPLKNEDGQDIDWYERGWWRQLMLCTADHGEQLKLATAKGEYSITVERARFKALDKPPYHIGDIVYAKSRKKQATVVGVAWHDKRDCFRYTLDYGDRVSTNWFFDDDLEMVECKWKERFDG